MRDVIIGEKDPCSRSAGRLEKMMKSMEEEAFVTQRAKTGVNQVSQSTMLLKKKKEMFEVDDALEFMKEEYKLRMEACEQRQRKFEKKQAEMKEQVNKFEKFIQENDGKRQRAELKAKQERKLAEQKDSELRGQLLELERLEEKRRQQIGDLEKLSMHKDYLDRVVEDSAQKVEEIWDLLNRHSTLSEANVDLTRQVQCGDVEIDNYRGKMEALKLQAQSIALVQNSDMKTKQQLLDRVRADAKRQDDLKLVQEERAKDVTRDTAQIVNAVRNLYHRCVTTTRTRLSAATVKTSHNHSNSSEGRASQQQLKQQLSACLDLIGDRISDLDDIRASYFLLSAPTPEANSQLLSVSHHHHHQDHHQNHHSRRRQLHSSGSSTSSNMTRSSKS